MVQSAHETTKGMEQLRIVWVRGCFGLKSALVLSIVGPLCWMGLQLQEIDLEKQCQDQNLPRRL
jgi:hypothetical protein